MIWKKNPACAWTIGILTTLLMFAGQAMAETAKLTFAPKVPPPIKRSKSAKVVVNFEAKEYTGTLADGVQYGFWSFGGTVPGPMVRVRVGDTIEFHLTNPETNIQPHNIDIHAVNGPGGGAAASAAAPGETKVFTFKAQAAGLFIYHCAAGAIVDHISNGMYGLFLVEPEGGLPKVDREFYVFQSEFFTDGNTPVAGLDISKGLAEQPDYVVFNGRAGSLIGP